MALLDTVPKLVEERTERTWSVSWGGKKHYREDKIRRYEWACDDTGGETTHEATYATGDYVLSDYGREIARGKTAGTWYEVYKDIDGSWHTA